MAGLEDHAGDMVRKSRVGLGIAAEEVATLLGWSLSALKTFEDKFKINEYSSEFIIC
ncbi:MAG: hypothetical protein VW579_01970 [Verrucomicrobiales bacterium]